MYFLMYLRAVHHWDEWGLVNILTRGASGDSEYSWRDGCICEGMVGAPVRQAS